MKQTISILQESIQSVNGGERTIIDTKERNSNYSLEQQVEACSIVNGYAKSATLEVVEQEVYDHQMECYGRFVLRNHSVKTVERIEPFVWIPADEQPRQEWQPILSWHCTSDSIEPNAETILLVRLVRHSTKHQWGELALRWLLRCIPVDHAGECAIKDTTTPAIEWYVMPLSLDNT
ncbi:hypothetical protein BDF22DRAFT_745520 [Syncephalis plumigaleata]|nr:hypothetical protein BDF22DRAFT_745520 [Syncephalis plumigaleata]